MVSNIQNAINGLSVPASGSGSLAITGTPTAAGTETFTVTATDSLGAATATTYSITVNPAVSLTLPTLAADTLGVVYSKTITASGGTGSVTLVVSNIRNPINGLSVPAGGSGSLAVTGTPTVAGTETFTVTATDSLGAATATTYSVTVNPAVSLTLPTLAADTLGVVYNQTIAASGGTGSVTLVVSNIQNAINGLSVPAVGSGSLTVTGTPSAAGTETFTVTATDSLGAATATTYSVTVNPASPLPSGFQSNGTTLTVHGTSASDRFTFDASGLMVVVSLDSESDSFAPGTFTNYVFAGAGGSATLTGGAGTNNALLYANGSGQTHEFQRLHGRRQRHGIDPRQRP